MIYFVGFAASALLPRSFPVELAWVDEAGLAESLLIKPAPQWLDPPRGPSEWNPISERAHGIALPTLLRQGLPHDEVARRAERVLAAADVTACSDTPSMGDYWLGRLHEAAGLRWEPRLLEPRAAYERACRPMLRSPASGGNMGRDQVGGRRPAIAEAIIDAAVEAEHVRPRVRHGALPDAAAMWRTWRAVKKEVARRVAADRPS